MKIFIRSFILSVITILLSMVMISCNQASVHTESDPRGRILFASDRNGQESYYWMNVDGDNIEAIDLGDLPPQTKVERPVWSPKQGKFFFSATVNKTSDLYAVDGDGTNLVNLTNTQDMYEASLSLSPDQNWLTFIRSGNGNDVYIMKTDGDDLLNLTQFQAKWYRDPKWSIDGKRIIFSSPRSGSPNIFSVDKDGQNLENISKGPGLDGKFSISPDGKQIAFDSDRDNYNDIFVVNIKDGEAVNLTNTDITREREPVWSPDGRYIAYRSDREGKIDLCVINLENDEIINLTNTPDIPEMSFSWSPTGEYLIFVAPIDSQMDIFKVKLDGTKPVNISNNANANDYMPIWLESP